MDYLHKLFRNTADIRRASIRLTNLSTKPCCYSISYRRRLLFIVVADMSARYTFESTFREVVIEIVGRVPGFYLFPKGLTTFSLQRLTSRTGDGRECEQVFVGRAMINREDARFTRLFSQPPCTGTLR